MIYQNVEDLKAEYKLNDALHSVRDLWYKLLEGYFTIPQSEEKLRLFTKYLQGELPKGWRLSIDHEGNIRVVSTFNGKFSQLSIYKNSAGQERVKVVPYEKNSPVTF